jgi:hypothetical protein
LTVKIFLNKLVRPFIFNSSYCYSHVVIAIATQVTVSDQPVKKLKKEKLKKTTLIFFFKDLFKPSICLLVENVKKCRVLPLPDGGSCYYGILILLSKYILL